MRRSRRAFTLVELLVVVTIIGVLIGLLVPAIWGAVRRAKQARAEAQLNTVAAALASFQTKYGSLPPSRLVFHESGYLGTPPEDHPTVSGSGRYFSGHPKAVAVAPIGGRDDGPIAGSQEHRALVARSVAALRTMFPKMRTSTEAWAAPMPPLGPDGTFYDINGNGTLDADPILLDGHECLALFLAGMADWVGSDGSGWEVRGAGGFGANPRNPFVAVPPDGPSASSRTAPYYDARPVELVDDDGDGVPGFVDPIASGDAARYLAYFASDHGGYDPRDCRLEDDSVATFRLSGVGEVASIGPNPWTTGDAGASASRWHRARSYQLLSPGLDRRYGPGGPIEQRGEETRYPGNDRGAEEDNVGMR